MALSPSELLALVQVVKISANALEAFHRGDLSRSEMNEAWGQIRDRTAAAEGNWEASKQTPAAQARRNET